jgi:PemK-like, MazF-like toxin of type II toxin-antitoxin system
MPERGDLLLIPFPFTDLSATKRRPVLALTAPDSYGDFVALPVTSRPQAEHAVALTAADLVSGSLPAASWIRTNRVVTLNSSLVVKVVGRVSERVVSAAIAQLFAYIGAS